MTKVTHYKNARQKRKIRSRIKMNGTKERPRVTVYRSNHAMFVQFIDDGARATLLGMSDKEIGAGEKNKIKRAQALGKKLAAVAKEKKITTVVFDRSGYAYHGRVKALAEGLREGGLIF